jgi:serine/threonine-protein kinase
MTDGRLWTFADFRIRDILDVDLVSTTYRATTVDGDESRRLRVFTEDIAGTAFVDLQEAVIAEARAARNVRHPHILATHDADRHDDRVYVESDDIRGVVLRDYIADHEPLNPATALAMGWQLAEALDAVHARGIVHGAINPHTIWVADSPGRDVPMIYLTGFGSARVLARHVIKQNGAPSSDDLLYVGPDQIRDERGNPEADRYALACAVYHLLTGVPPFRRGSINALLGAHLFSAVEPPTTMRDDLPAALDSVFARALAKDTSERYPSASALMIAVERGLGGQEDAGPLARRRRSNRANALPDGGRGPAVFDPHSGAAPTPSAPAGPAEPPARSDAAAGGAIPTDDVPAVVRDAETTPDDSMASSDHALDDTDPLRASADGRGRPSGRRGEGTEDGRRRPSGRRGEGTEDGADPVEPAAGDGGPTAGTDVDRPASQWVDFAALRRGSTRVAPPTDAPLRGVGDAPESGDDDLTFARATMSNGEHAVAAKEGATTLDGVGAPDTRRPSTPNDAGTLEARRAARELDGARPTVALPPDSTVAFPFAPSGERNGLASWRSDLRGHVERRRGALAVVAGVLVVVAAVAVAFATLRAPSAEVPAPSSADPERDRGGPASIPPLWTTPFATQAVRSIEVTDHAVLLDAGTTIGALEPASGTTLWTERTRGEVTDVAALDHVMIVRTANKIRGYDVTTGARRWTRAAARVGEMVAGNRELYAVSHLDTGLAVSTIDPTDGGVDRMTTIPDGTAGDEQGQLALAFDSGAKKGDPTLYILTRSALYAFDPDAESVRWRAPVSDRSRRETPRLRARPWVPSLGVASGAAFVVDRDGRICRHAAVSGEQVWTTCQAFPAEVTTPPTLLARGGRVTVATGDAIAAYDFTNGLPLWSQTPADGALAAVAAGPRMAYVARDKGGVQALDGESGRDRWRSPEVDEVTALAADDEGVFVGRADGSIVRLVQRTVGQADVQ